MEPEIFQDGSPWGNLWLISMAIFAVTWALIITAAVSAAAVSPYLAVRTMTARTTAGRTTAGPGRSRATGRTNRKLLLAAAVTGLAHGVGAAKHHTTPASARTSPTGWEHTSRRCLTTGPSGPPWRGLGDPREREPGHGRDRRQALLARAARRAGVRLRLAPRRIGRLSGNEV